MKTNIRTIIRSLLAIILVWCNIVVSSAQATPSDTTFYGSYPYIYIVGKGMQPRLLTEEEFLQTASKVIFPVNKWFLPQDAPLLRELEEEVIPRLNRDSLQLVRLLVRGAASPEGPTSFNLFLSQHRYAALYDFLKERLTMPAFKNSYTSYEVEDYRMVCLLMRDAGDADYEYVKELCDTYLPDNRISELKKRLQQAQGGRLWYRLLKTYYPQVRAARVVLFLRKATPASIEAALSGAEPESMDICQVSVISSEGLTLPNRSSFDWSQLGSHLLQTYPRRELLSIKTNLLFYGVYMPGYDRWCPIPNVAVEYYPKRGHFTFGGSFDMPWWQDYDGHKYFQIRNYQLETRYYMKGSNQYGTNGTYGTFGDYKAPAFRGFYVSAYAHAGLFGICFDADRGWVGEGAGGGIGAGYVMPISKNGHWRLEFAAQAGFFRCKYDPYKYENPINPAYHDDLYYYKWTQKPELFKKRQYRFSWIGPTRIGVTLTYDLLYRRIQRKGASFVSTEITTLHQPLSERTWSQNTNSE